MRKILIILAVGILLVGLTGCGVKEAMSGDPIVIEVDNVKKIYSSEGKKIGQLNNNEFLVSQGADYGLAGGYGVMKQDFTEYIIDAKGKRLYKAPENYSLEKVGRDAFMLSDYTTSQLINHNGKVIIPPGKFKNFECDIYASKYNKVMYIVAEGLDGKYGVFTEKGEEVLKPRYNSVKIDMSRKNVAVIIADEKIYLCINGKKDIALTTEDYRVYDWYNTDCVYIRTFKSERLYLVKDGKMWDIGNYGEPCNYGYRYMILATKSTDGKAIYDTETKKIVGQLDKVVYSTGEIPVILSAERDARTVKVVTPYYSTQYDNVRGAGVLGNGYYYIETLDSETSTLSYTIYNSKGKKVLVNRGVYQRMSATKDYSGKPISAIAGDGVAFICGDAKESSTGLQLIGINGKTIINNKDVVQMYALGNSVVVENSNKMFAVYKPNGAKVLNNVTEIDYNKVVGTTSYSKVPKNCYIRVNINGKYGLYDFNNYKFIIKPNFKSLGRIIEESYYRGKDTNNKDVFFNPNGVQLK